MYDLKICKLVSLITKNNLEYQAIKAEYNNAFHNNNVEKLDQCACIMESLTAEFLYKKGIKKGFNDAMKTYSKMQHK